MKIKFVILSGIVLCMPLLSYASDKFFVQVPAVLDPAAPIINSVKNECGIEQLVGNQVFQEVNERIGGAEQLQDVGKAGNNRLLTLTILAVQGVGGGSWSGSKAISVRAQLMQDDQVIRTTVFRRKSRGGVFGGVSGTCPIMERIAIALGKDVANWLPKAMLANPATEAMPANMTPTKDQDNDALESE